MREKLVSMLLTGLVLAAFALPAHAVIVFSEDFDDIELLTDPLPLVDETPGPATPGSSFTTNVAPGTGGSINVRADASDFFGAGTTNQYLELIDGTGTAVLRGPAALNGTGFQISLSFYDPSGGTANQGNRVILSDSTNSGSARTVDLNLRNGILYYHNGSGDQLVADYTYTEDVAHSLHIFGNYSPSIINYDFSGSQSVAPGKYDIFIDDLLVLGGVPFRNSLTATTHFGLSATGATTLTTSYFDNIVVETLGAPSVPGDYNDDGFVDAADYVVWRDNLGGAVDSLSNRDPNNTDFINDADYEFWAANFGNPSGLGSGNFASAVPEPSAAILIGIGLIGLAYTRLRGRK